VDAHRTPELFGFIALHPQPATSTRSGKLRTPMPWPREIPGSRHSERSEESRVHCAKWRFFGATRLNDAGAERPAENVIALRERVTLGKSVA